MRSEPILNKRESLIELLVALVICGIVIAGAYRFFIPKPGLILFKIKSLIAERSWAMEILLRDLQMAGYDDDSVKSTITITDPIVAPLRMTPSQSVLSIMTKLLCSIKNTRSLTGEMNPSRLIRQLTINDVAGSPDVLLEASTTSS
jgi:prepilin-type N-terminal cleavage/methylation domain-containing protein